MQNSVQNNKFNFFVPLGSFEKSRDGESSKYLMRVKGIASTIDEDADNEFLDPSGMNCSELLSFGMANWNHQASKTSSAICGIPVAARLVPINKSGAKGLELEIDILNNTEGRAVAELIEALEHDPNRKIGMSIEGRKLTVDPFNPKKIKTAMISGVAFTHMPKNKNTFVSIMKGEYSEPFIEDNQDDEETITCKKCGHINTKENKCSCIVKDMTTESIEPATPESVEHDPKKISNNITKKFGNVINKSEIYISILNKYNSQIAETKKIYSLVEKTNQNLFSMTNTISDEAIQKSFDLLDEAIALTKSKETEALVPDKKEDVASEEDLKKSKDIAEFLINKAGMSKEDACDHLVKGGFTLSVAQGAAESVIAEMNAKKQGGDITATGDPIVKSEEVSVLISEEIKKSFAPITDTISKGFEGVNDIVKALREQNNALNERLDKFESGSQGRKSITTSSAIDRFEKGNDSTKLQAGEEIINVGSKKDLARLVSRLDAENTTIMARTGEPDNLLIKSIETIEICSVVPEDSYSRIRSLGIILQQG